MAKIGRNAPCPCGSGRKYKKCCHAAEDGKRKPPARPMKYIPVYTELDQLSNSVVDLVKQNRLDEAEAVSQKLLTDYPDQVDGLNRLAMRPVEKKTRRQSIIAKPQISPSQILVLMSKV